MNKKLMEIWNHISNTKSLLAIASSVLIIINTLGLAVDSTMVMKAINA
jgi:energy-converting hydrogenase Eha subunit F